MKNKVAIITGASSGIGKAIAKEWGKMGAKVVISGRTEATLRQVEQELKQANIAVKAVVGDVAVQADCERLIAETIAHYGKIDILVNNAGISMRALFEEVDLKVLHQLMNINFWGTVYCTHYALPYLKASKGTAVGISSIAGIKGLPARTGYSASKFAMHGFLESLRIEHLHTGLHVLICCPGFTASNIRNTALSKDGSAQGETPRDEAKMMQPEEVAQRLAQAVRARKRMLILTRQGRLTTFVNKWLPGWLDKQVFKHLAAEPDSPLKRKK